MNPGVQWWDPCVPVLHALPCQCPSFHPHFSTKWLMPRKTNAYVAFQVWRTAIGKTVLNRKALPGLVQTPKKNQKAKFALCWNSELHLWQFCECGEKWIIEFFFLPHTLKIQTSFYQLGLPPSVPDLNIDLLPWSKYSQGSLSAWAEHSLKECTSWWTGSKGTGLGTFASLLSF